MTESKYLFSPLTLGPDDREGYADFSLDNSKINRNQYSDSPVIGELIT